MSIRFLLLGDVMPGENHYHFGRGIRTLYGNDYSNLIDPVLKRELFSSVDFVLFNFEYSLVEDNFQFSNITSSVYSAKKSSLNIFPNNIIKCANIANNHFSEHGYERTKSTIEILKNNGINIVGENNKPTYVFLKGKRLLLWGVSLIKDKDTTGLYFKSNYEELLSKIEIPPCKEENDLWIISIHWGDEYIDTANNLQSELAYRMASLGFDLIHGHHPHVYQQIEKINNTYIIYSCGNFIFDQNFSKKTRKGLAVFLEFEMNKLDISKVLIIISKYFKPVYFIHCDFKRISMTGKVIKPFQKWIIQILYRILMKLEVLYNIRYMDLQTRNFLLYKIAKRK